MANYKCMFLNIKLAERKSCYCAFCKVQRKVHSSKNLTLMSVIGLLGLSLLVTYIIWQTLDPRGLFILGLFLFVGEIFHQLRWRQSMICSNCGFDPVLYLKDPEKAGLKIKEFLAYRSERPEYLLKPPVQLPVRKVAAKGHNISLRG